MLLLLLQWSNALWPVVFFARAGGGGRVSCLAAMRIQHGYFPNPKCDPKLGGSYACQSEDHWHRKPHKERNLRDFHMAKAIKTLPKWTVYPFVTRLDWSPKFRSISTQEMSELLFLFVYFSHFLSPGKGIMMKKIPLERTSTRAWRQLHPGGTRRVATSMVTSKTGNAMARREK